MAIYHQFQLFKIVFKKFGSPEKYQKLTAFPINFCSIQLADMSVNFPESPLKIALTVELGACRCPPPTCTHQPSTPHPTPHPPPALMRPQRPLAPRPEPTHPSHLMRQLRPLAPCPIAPLAPCPIVPLAPPSPPVLRCSWPYSMACQWCRYCTAAMDWSKTSSGTRCVAASGH